MTQDEQLRLWAYQWATRGKPELPDDWQLYVVDNGAQDVRWTPADDPCHEFVIEMRGFIVDDGVNAFTCEIGCNADAKVFVVTPVIQEAWEYSVGAAVLAVGAAV